MKKNIILSLCITIIIFANCKAIPPIDTLQVLNMHIENQKNKFIGKPFKVLTDTLKKIKIPVFEYSGARDSKFGISQNDTIWVNGFDLYFSSYFDSGKMTLHHNAIANGQANSVNTHIKVIKVSFTKPIPYLRAWNYLTYADDDERASLKGTTWNGVIARFYRDCVIKDLKVYEY